VRACRARKQLPLAFFSSVAFHWLNCAGTLVTRHKHVWHQDARRIRDAHAPSVVKDAEVWIEDRHTTETPGSDYESLTRNLGTNVIQFYFGTSLDARLLASFIKQQGVLGTAPVVWLPANHPAHKGH